MTSEILPGGLDPDHAALMIERDDIKNSEQVLTDAMRAGESVPSLNKSTSHPLPAQGSEGSLSW